MDSIVNQLNQLHLSLEKYFQSFISENDGKVVEKEAYFRHLGFFRKDTFWSLDGSYNINLDLCNLFPFPVNGNKWLYIGLEFEYYCNLKLESNDYLIEIMNIRNLLFMVGYDSIIYNKIEINDNKLNTHYVEYLLCLNSSVDLDFLVSFLKIRFLLIKNSKDKVCLDIFFLILNTSMEIANFFKATYLFSRYFSIPIKRQRICFSNFSFHMFKMDVSVLEYYLLFSYLNLKDLNGYYYPFALKRTQMYPEWSSGFGHCNNDLNAYIAVTLQLYYNNNALLNGIYREYALQLNLIKNIQLRKYFFFFFYLFEYRSFIYISKRYYDFVEQNREALLNLKESDKQISLSRRLSAKKDPRYIRYKMLQQKWIDSVRKEKEME